MNIETDFISKPYYTKEYKLGDNILLLKWNIFNDKKDDNRLVMRIRYILFDENDERLSLKVLNLKNPVISKQIYISDNIKKEINNNSTEYIINKYFNFWLENTFRELFEI